MDFFSPIYLISLGENFLTALSLLRSKEDTSQKMQELVAGLEQTLRSNLLRIDNIPTDLSGDELIGFVLEDFRESIIRVSFASASFISTYKPIKEFAFPASLFELLDGIKSKKKQRIDALLETLEQTVGVDLSWLRGSENENLHLAKFFSLRCLIEVAVDFVHFSRRLKSKENTPTEIQEFSTKVAQKLKDNFQLSDGVTAVDCDEIILSVIQDLKRDIINTYYTSENLGFFFNQGLLELYEDLEIKNKEIVMRRLLRTVRLALPSFFLVYDGDSEFLASTCFIFLCRFLEKVHELAPRQADTRKYMLEGIWIQNLIHFTFKLNTVPSDRNFPLQRVMKILDLVEEITSRKTSNSKADVLQNLEGLERRRKEAVLFFDSFLTRFRRIEKMLVVGPLLHGLVLTAKLLLNLSIVFRADKVEDKARISSDKLSLILQFIHSKRMGKEL